MKKNAALNAESIQDSILLCLIMNTFSLQKAKEELQIPGKLIGDL